MSPAEDQRYMSLALALGARGLGHVWPNPAVGAVLVRPGLTGGRIVGRGWTQAGGRPHAETMALAQAGDQARGATAYVSLEPCAHHGQTPPCADALIAAGIVRIVSALEDPDPRVAGQGHARLRQAGVAVTTGLLAAEAERIHQGFLSRVRLGRPFVTLKLASSFDGKIATASGQSRWITGPQARAFVHMLRASHDGVLIGGGTARADDPLLTIRDLGMTHQPVRIVAARHLDLQPEGRLAQSAHQTPLWLLHGQTGIPPARLGHWQQKGARLIPVALSGGQLDPLAMLQAMAQAGLTRVLCEGGGALAASLLQAGLVDQLIGFTAGMILGAEGQPGIGATGIATLAEAQRFTLQETRAIGPDVLHIWRASAEQTSPP